MASLLGRLSIGGCSCSGRREDGRTRCALRLALGFDFADQHGGSDGADRNAAGFGSADAVEDVGLVVGGEDAVERGLRSAYDANAADELIGSAVDVDAVDDERDDLEGLGRAAGSDGE